MARIIVGINCAQGLECGLMLNYGVKFEVVLQIKNFGQPPSAKKGTHTHEEDKKGVGRGGRVSFTSNFGRTFFCQESWQNDRNISTQHMAGNIIKDNMLHAFGHPAVMCLITIINNNNNYNDNNNNNNNKKH